MHEICQPIEYAWGSLPIAFSFRIKQPFRMLSRSTCTGYERVATGGFISVYGRLRFKSVSCLFHSISNFSKILNLIFYLEFSSGKCSEALQDFEFPL